jgi:hypothetical protein
MARTLTNCLVALLAVAIFFAAAATIQVISQHVGRPLSGPLAAAFCSVEHHFQLRGTVYPLRPNTIPAGIKIGPCGGEFDLTTPRLADAGLH